MTTIKTNSNYSIKELVELCAMGLLDEVREQLEKDKKLIIDCVNSAKRSIKVYEKRNSGSDYYVNRIASIKRQLEKDVDLLQNIENALTM